MIHRIVDKIATHYAQGAWSLETARARREFMTHGGEVFDDDGDLFEQRLAAFTEWYVVERPLAHGAPPAVLALMNTDADTSTSFLDADERRETAFVATSHRSVFDALKVEGGVIDLEDVATGARFAVVERRSTVGFQEGDLFEARLLWDGQSVVFGKTFLFHPREARDTIANLVDQARERGTSPGDLAFQLARSYVRWVRFGQLNAPKVYRGAAT